jgi:hypothetical protein
MEAMPGMGEIPKEFKDSWNPWVKWQNQWFFDGLPEFPKAKEGIDSAAAKRHLAFIQGSWDTSHEHKEAAVAYLASLWLLDPVKNETGL